MGIAERFKNKLENLDIFSKKVPQETKKYVSQPIQNEQKYPLENIESLIIEKIRRTPYWNEYSIQKQENLISSYFENKQVKYNISDDIRKDFIKNIINLLNNE